MGTRNTEFSSSYLSATLPVSTEWESDFLRYRSFDSLIIRSALIRASAAGAGTSTMGREAYSACVRLREGSRFSLLRVAYHE